MEAIGPTRRLIRRSLSTVTTIGLVVGMLAATIGPTAAAQPPRSTALTYHFTDCTGPAGTPTSFDGVKQPGGAAALHLVDGSGVFIAVQAIDAESGAILFTTRGFEHNNLPTVMCQLIHPVTSRLQSVTGMIAPVTGP